MANIDPYNYPNNIVPSFPSYQTERVRPPAFYPVKSDTNDMILAIILDESSSMESCYEQTCAGFDEFIKTHKNADESKAGRVFVTLVTFNGSKVVTRYENKPIAEVPTLRETYRPAGMTNLLDAIGESLIKINQTIEAIPYAYRPGVIVAIFTDGEENQSRRFNNDDVRDYVANAEKAEWTFTFFGANIDAFSVGMKFGMNHLNTVQYDTRNMGATMAMASASMVGARMMKAGGMSTHDVYQTLYSDEDREKVK